MNEHDATLYAEERGIEDGAKRCWSPPFNRSYAGDLTKIYASAWWEAFMMGVVAEEFPNG